ncbi:hypothetical protein GPJ56_003767 [Histomonas meleagridis]|uniref:uncharacterized protein n=1 Tax=Histomonas meleagridis TaxID=135588 RepID=UPI00355AAC1B|nr:hypothetical protein GPJ56_003767 [Histomonas meleagridis]KAH0805225.1 hypothetical protein GO595_002170 [Histomonas meleagridis]
MSIGYKSQSARAKQTRERYKEIQKKMDEDNSNDDETPVFFDNSTFISDEVIQCLENALLALRDENIDSREQAIKQIAQIIHDYPSLIQNIPITDEIIVIISYSLKAPSPETLECSIFLLLSLIKFCQPNYKIFIEQKAHVVVTDAVKQRIPFPLAHQLLEIMIYLSSSNDGSHIETLFRSGFVTTVLDLLSYFNVQTPICRGTPPLQQLPYIPTGIDSEDSVLLQPLLLIARNLLRIKTSFLSVEELIGHVIGISITIPDIEMLNLALSSVFIASEEYFDCFWKICKSLGFISSLIIFTTLSPPVQIKSLKILQNIFFHQQELNFVKRYTDLCQRIRDLLTNDNEKLIIYGLNVLNNICEIQDSDFLTWIIETEGLIEIIAHLMENGSYACKVTSCGFFYNLIYAGNFELCCNVIERVDLIGIAIPLFSSDDYNLISVNINLFDLIISRCQNDENLITDICQRMVSNGILEETEQHMEDTIQIYTEILALRNKIVSFLPPEE